MGELRIPLEGVVLVIASDALNEGDPGFELVAAAVRSYARITVKGVNVTLPPGVLGDLWKRVGRGTITLEIRSGQDMTGAASREPVQRDHALVRRYVYREQDRGPVWLDFNRALTAEDLHPLLHMLGAPPTSQTATGLRALIKIVEPYRSMIWDEAGGRFNLSKLAELVRLDKEDKFWAALGAPELPNFGPRRLALVVQFADRDWEVVVG